MKPEFIVYADGAVLQLPDFMRKPQGQWTQAECEAYAALQRRQDQP